MLQTCFYPVAGDPGSINALEILSLKRYSWTARSHTKLGAPDGCGFVGDGHVRGLNGRGDGENEFNLGSDVGTQRGLLQRPFW